MRATIALLLGFMAASTPSFGQSTQPVIVTGGALAPASSVSNGIVLTTVTCGTTSTAFGVTGASYLAIQVPPGAGTVCFAPGSTAATLSPPFKCYGGGTGNTAAGFNVWSASNIVGRLGTNGKLNILLGTDQSSAFSGLAIMASYTVSTLPTGIQGGRVYVTDAVACVFGTVPTGGGTTKCPVFYNGSAWVGS